MAIDTPTISYKTEKKKGLTRKQAESLQAQWEERQRRNAERNEKPLDLNEFLRMK